LVELSAGGRRRKRDIDLCLRSVYARTNPCYHALIAGFFARIGVPILLNTSLNENEPVVRTPAEAVSCFLRTAMDALVLGTQVTDCHAPNFPEH
jgi:carbamoyltransferase